MREGKIYGDKLKQEIVVENNCVAGLGVLRYLAKNEF
jgi:hypothetical protein